MLVIKPAFIYYEHNKMLEAEGPQAIEMHEALLKPSDKVRPTYNRV